jgi:rare lipoprotein A
MCLLALGLIGSLVSGAVPSARAVEAEEAPRLRGEASWYGPGLEGEPTASGETFDAAKATAAHPSLPLPSWACVTNVGSGLSIVVRVNDRGPHVDRRVIDLSREAAALLGFIEDGVAEVRVEPLGEARSLSDPRGPRFATGEPC